MKIYKNLDINNLENEVWKVITDFPDYFISNLGRIKSFKKWHGINERILKQCKNDKGYFFVNLYKNGNKKPKYIHRLVYETFKEKLEDGYDAHHINEDQKDNFVDNLESKEHKKHIGEHHKGLYHSEDTKNKISKSQKGEKNHNFGIKFSEQHKTNMSNTRKEKFKNNELDLKGENHPSHKLTNQKISDIRIDIEKGDLIQIEIAKKHNVSRSTISMIKIGKIWSHVK